MPLRSTSNGREALAGSSCAGQRPLALEAGEDAEGVNALRHAAGQGHVALAQPQHLHALDHARVARGAGGADRVVRPGDAQVQRNLAGRVVGHGARIVVVRPELGVVVEALELVDFVFGLDVAVLGHADVDADRRACRRSPSRGRRRRPPRWRSRCRCCRPGCRGGGPCVSGSAARRSCRRRPRWGRRSGSRRRVTPLRPASRLSRNSGRLLPLGAVSPTPVMTIRSGSVASCNHRAGRSVEVRVLTTFEVTEVVSIMARPRIPGERGLLATVML